MRFSRGRSLAKGKMAVLELFLCWGVAQLGERRVRNAKVEGSSPFLSTKNIKGLQVIFL